MKHISSKREDNPLNLFGKPTQKIDLMIFGNQTVFSYGIRKYQGEFNEALSNLIKQIHYIKLLPYKEYPRVRYLGGRLIAESRKLFQ